MRADERPGVVPVENPVSKRALGPFAVSPVGFGAMQLTGPGVFGPPADREGAVGLLRLAIELGIDHIDTAQFYGPDVVNQLIREALYPYPPELVLVSKVGARRDARGGIFAYDQPAELRKCIEDNLRTLGVDSLSIVNLRVMRAGPPDALFNAQLAAMIAARSDGLIREIGLSNVSVAHLERAHEAVDIACVQNALHLADRRSQAVLDECARRGIAFVPFAPLGSGRLMPPDRLSNAQLGNIARRFGCTRSQLAIAWSLALSPNILAIPGTSSIEHLRENVAAASVALDATAVAELSDLGTERS